MKSLSILAVICLSLPVAGLGQREPSAPEVRMTAIGDKNSVIYEVNGNVSITYNIEIICPSGCHGDELPFAEIHRYFPNATVNVNYSVPGPAAYGLAGAETAVPSNSYLPTGYGTAPDAPTASYSPYASFLYPQAVYEISVNGVWNQNAPSPADTMAELRSLTMSSPITVASSFLVTSGIGGGSSSPFGGVGSPIRLGSDLYLTSNDQAGTLALGSSATAWPTLQTTSNLESAAFTPPSAWLDGPTTKGNGGFLSSEFINLSVEGPSKDYLALYTSQLGANIVLNQGQVVTGGGSYSQILPLNDSNNWQGSALTVGGASGNTLSGTVDFASLGIAANATAWNHQATEINLTLNQDSFTAGTNFPNSALFTSNDSYSWTHSLGLPTSVLDGAPSTVLINQPLSAPASNEMIWFNSIAYGQRIVVGQIPNTPTSAIPAYIQTPHSPDAGMSQADSGQGPRI